MTTLEEVKARFSDDKFAQYTGIEITEAERGRAVCILTLRPEHMNANNVPMGGAIFTLADFCFAVAANTALESGHTVSQHVSITYLSPAKGSRLIAEASCIKAGRRTCLYEVHVTDEMGTQVAHVTVNGFTL